jgi:outer membrane receptor protein involved in Fe transport
MGAIMRSDSGYSTEWRAAPRIVRKGGYSTIITAAIGLCVVIPCQRAIAQSAIGADASLQEVVVTAQKQPERLHDVPVSVAVLSGDALRDQSADKLEDYVARVPGLVLFSQSPGQQEVTIRGLSTGPQGPPTVSTYIDDAPVGVSTGDGGGGLLTPAIDSIDLQRIEVLRGPQGTLYGASNIGGLLKYVTIAPNTQQLEGEVGAEGNSADHGADGYALRGRVNVPITDDAAFLVTAYKRHDPGFISDAGRGLRDVDGTDVEGARLAILWTPTSALSIKGTALGQDRNANGFSEVDVDPTTLTPLYGQYQQRRAAGSEYYQTQMRLYFVTADYDLGWGHLNETTSYNTLRYHGSQDESQGFASFFPNISGIGVSALYGISENKLSQEVRLSGHIGGFADGLIGVYYTHENTETLVNFPTFNYFTGVPIDVPSLLDSDIGTHYNEYAAFGELTYHLTARFDVIGGVRYAYNDEMTETSSSGTLIGSPSMVPSSSHGDSPTFSFSPRLKLNEDMTLYARVASGYRPGGANGGYAPAPTYGPDKDVNYEIGLKGDVPSERLSFEIAVFHVKWTDIQLQLLNAQGLQYTNNAGGAASQGLELAGSYSPLKGLTLGASAAYTDAHLTRDIPSGAYGVKGNQLPFSPRFKGSVNADYDFHLLGDWSGFVGASYRYTGDELAIFASDAGTPRLDLPGYGTVDARMGAKTDRLDVDFFVKNVADKVGYNGVTPLTFNPTGNTALSIIQPRTIGISLTMKF